MTADYQPNNFDGKKAARVIVLLGGAIALSLGGVAWLLSGYRHHLPMQPPPMSTLERQDVKPPEPRLLANPRQAGEQQLADQRLHLESYGWVDRAHHIVHLPLAQARQLLLERGWPDEH
ncbi:hypothetical protein [Pseudomonas palleroniana]|uniref:hypothetical protein n=1 Tax=Pseudomonas palleroniana TaxID=191390 RepID=UPI0018E67963|nr:hypothetical protein [Pseudomonas palleroniana]MBI6908297.1 hypothetical protein [Pseudomonas palleroniana]